MVAWFDSRLLSSCCILSLDFSAACHFGGRTNLTQTSSFEGVYSSWASFVQSVAHKDKFGYPMHSFSRSRPLCDRVWRRWVDPTLIPFMWHLWFSLVTRSGLDWLFDGGCTQSLRSFCSVHSFSGQSQISMPGGPSCSLYGLLVFGWCGMREIFEFS
jgi:hypothetical protein